MAENRYIKGLFKDTAHIDQPKGSWRYAKNMVMNEKMGAISNEGGTSLNTYLGSTVTSTGAINDKVIGAIEVNNDRTILFVLDVVTAVNPRSEIGIWEDGNYTILFNPSPAGFPDRDLKFNENFPISGTFKVNAVGDLIIYFTDDLNPPRAFNVDRQRRESTSISQLYGIVNFNHIDLINLFPYAGSVPHIDVIDNSSSSPGHQLSVGTGGGLRTGVYYLALAYVDDDYVATNYLTVSNPIPIVDEYDTTRPTTKKDGIKAGSQTSKSITWRVNNINTDYKYLRPVVIRKMGDAADAFKLNDIEVTVTNAVNTQDIIFTGIEGFSSGSVESVIIDTTSYDTAKTITQLDNILYVGNTTGSKDVGFQKYANNIKVNSVIKTFPVFDEYWATMDNLNNGFANSPVDEGNIVDDTQSYRFVPNIFKYRGYTRDEIYAFYIAFILKDGSMSYAYHIPGRAQLTNQAYSQYNLLSGNANETSLIPGSLRVNYDEQAAHYQFYDLSNNVSGANIASTGAARHMNFWQNMTEVYPTSDDYEVWNRNGYVSTLQGTPVRHNHFPSNENYERCSIMDSTDSVISNTISSWTPATTAHFTGTYYSCISQSSAFWMNNSYATTLANVGRINLATITSVVPTGTNPTPPHDTSHNNHCFTATSPDTQVEVMCHFKFFNDHSVCNQTWRVRVRYFDSIAGTTTTVSRTGGSAVCADSYWSGNELRGDLGTAGGNDDRVGYTGTWAWTESNMNMNDQIWMEGWGSQRGASGWSTCTAGGSTPRRVEITQACWTGPTCAYSSAGSWARFRVQIIPPTGGDYRDVDLKHEVRALGFELEDIHVPRSIADKAQGFRIYRADRTYSNRTVLGQDIGKPQFKLRALLGLCLEVAGSNDALQGLKPLIDKEETLYHNSAFSKDASNYTLAVSTDQNNNGVGYKNFSFHDFYMLRKKTSLAPATHVKVEYTVGDYTWNGPDLRQDRKMLSEIDASTTNNNGLYTVTERWGWDTTGTPLNCYPPYINSAVFMGGLYMNTTVGYGGNDMRIGLYELNRPIGQKAKSYIMGDTIFDGTPLGLGKIVNLLGESHIAFGLRDGWELPSLVSTQDLDGSGGNAGNPWNLWGIYEDDSDMILVTDNTELSDDATARHKSYMLNLKSYKTDLYKSIDSNALIWTGFEVLGDDFENYIFEDASGSMSGTGHTVDTHPEGIWGGDTFLCRYGVAKGVRPLDDQTLSIPEKAIYYHIVESSDNINFRHQDSGEAAYFPLTPATHLIRYVGTEDHDYTHKDKIGYNDNYSLSNDVRTAFPLPLRVDDQDDFTTRAHRSAKNDTTSLIDNYRTFLANQFKDLPKNRGELWKLSSFNNLLYFHMEESLFAAKGKQSMQMNDGSEAFVGSGDIFTQDPDEMIQTEGGFAGTQSMYAAITTRFGYFFVDQSSRKVFLMTDNAQEISNLGMWHWFLDNLPYELESYGMPGNNFDNPIWGMGYHSIWDPMYKRIILTKRELKPTALFIASYGVVAFMGVRWNKTKRYYERAPLFGTNWNKIEWTDTSYFEPSGWTISYYPELSAWGSFHDYVPYIYFNTSKNFYSLTDQYARPAWTAATPIGSHVGTTYGNTGIWEHNNHALNGLFYQENDAGEYTNAEWLTSIVHSLFEFEYVHNELKADTLLHSSFDYTLETFNQDNISVLEHGFTSFIIYNTFQIDTSALEYLVNTRRIGNEWKVNKFRDMAAIAVNTNPYYMSTNTNVTGQVNTGTTTTSSINNMFTVDGMNEVINNSYMDLTKNWTLQKKFIDKWVGIRLIYDNVSNNLLNLYSTNVAVRKMHR